VVLAGAWVAAPLMVLLLASFEVAAFGAIAAGASLAWARPRAMPYWLAIPAGAVLLIATIISPSHHVPLRLAVVAAALVLMMVALRPMPGLSNSALRYIGTISYGIYLWHVPVRWALTQAGVDSTWSPGMLVGIGLSFGLAAASWHLVESRIVSRRPPLRGSAAASDSLPRSG
jgi:peptidoglycan/LPS O-acetylase OafA/YrhL